MKKLISTILVAAMLTLIPVSNLGAKVERVKSSRGWYTNVITLDGSVGIETFEQFMKATDDSRVKHWVIRINTNGGDAFSTVGIISRILELKRQGVKFTTLTYTRAFSAGGYLFLMGDERIAYEGSSLMFHTMMQQFNRSYDPKGAREDAERNAPSTIAMMKRLDDIVSDRFCKVTGLDKGSAAATYWLKGEMPDGSTVPEGAQFMSGRTAYNIKVATKLIEM